MDHLSPTEFVSKWGTELSGERRNYQQHFIDVCLMLGHPPPAPNSRTEDGKWFGFEKSIQKQTGGLGYADVWYEGHFAIEYKSEGSDLKAAYAQLLQYRENLKNPPLLIVCDFRNWEIHTNFPNTEKRIYAFDNDAIQFPRYQQILKNLFTAPESLHPERNAAQATEEATERLQFIVDSIRADYKRRRDKLDSNRLADFISKLVFCLFAEDVDLLPLQKNEGIFSQIVNLTCRDADSERFIRYATELFRAMANGHEMFMHRVPYFNGALFRNIEVEALGSEARLRLFDATKSNWSAIEPAIFGTLFERILDESKRAQLGAHYTSRQDIELIVEPILMQPLKHIWEAIKAEATAIRPQMETARSTREKQALAAQLIELRGEILTRLRTITILDPACGSGNFLYVALSLLLDLEKTVINDPLWRDLPREEPQVHPRQLYGIEKDELAHALASIVVWIGYIQWRRNNGYLHFAEPILQDLSDHILCQDAILNFDGDGNPVEPSWQSVDIILSNPPFLGDKLMRSELGAEYVQALRQLYEGRVPGQSDLVCYWFERARTQLEQSKLKRAGMLATNSIRGGANRVVMDRIKQTGDIFWAWGDRPWLLKGAAVRISMIGFDDGSQKEYLLDGAPVLHINADLQNTIDATKARHQPENVGFAFQGPVKVGKFDINPETALALLAASNASGKNNQDVVRPWVNGMDIVQQPRRMWIVDFSEMEFEQAQQYEAPFKYIEENVKPSRDLNRRNRRREKWWQHGETIPGLRAALSKLNRYIITPRVSKHRIFVWMDTSVLPDSATVAIARDDDYFFGVLHSRFHELWSLRLGTWLGKGNDPRYTPTTTFETFPFPTLFSQGKPGEEVAAAAKQLHEERQAWLMGEGALEKDLKDRTLTNLYNALNVLHDIEQIKVPAKASNFAPRLHELHKNLDRAVCAAYGWEEEILEHEEEMLRRLLALNLQRSEA